MTRTILITGANNGIGLALTRSLLDMGNLPATSNLLPIVCDVTDPKRVQAVIDEISR